MKKDSTPEEKLLKLIKKRKGSGEKPEREELIEQKGDLKSLEAEIRVIRRDATGKARMNPPEAAQKKPADQEKPPEREEPVEQKKAENPPEPKKEEAPAAPEIKVIKRDSAEKPQGTIEIVPRETQGRKEPSGPAETKVDVIKGDTADKPQQKPVEVVREAPAGQRKEEVKPAGERIAVVKADTADKAQKPAAAKKAKPLKQKGKAPASKKQKHLKKAGEEIARRQQLVELLPKVFMLLTVLILIYLAIDVFVITPRYRREIKELSSEGASTGKQIEEGAAAKEEQASQPTKPYSYYSKDIGGRDIFKPLVQTKKGGVDTGTADVKKNLSLIGIVEGETLQAAIADEKSGKTYFVTKGESVEDMVVEDVFPNKVILDYRGERIELML